MPLKIANFTPDGPFKYKIRASYDNSILKEFRKFPGATWDGKRVVRVIGDDLVPYFMNVFKKYGFQVAKEERIVPEPDMSLIPDKFFPFQKLATEFCYRNKRTLVSTEMGLGKTLVGIGVMIQIAAQGPLHGLVICPSSVKYHWVEKLDEWWPLHPPATVLETSKDVTAYLDNQPEGDHILVISTTLCHTLTDKVEVEVRGKPKLVHKMKPELNKFDCIVFDESHMGKNVNARCSKAVRALSEDVNSNSYMIELTGTPITKNPIDVYNQADILRPGIFGGNWNFKNRYCLSEINLYADSGLAFSGLNDDYSGELRDRLAQFCTRTTKHEVAHLMPALNTTCLKIMSKQKIKCDNFSKMSESEKSNVIRKCGQAKISVVMEQVENAIEQSETVCVLPYYHETADALYQKLTTNKNLKGKKVVYINGTIPVKKRAEMIQEAKENDAILLATIKANSLGIDLTHWTTPIYAELYYTAAVMTQSMLRFHRLSSKLPVNIIIPIVMGTIDEPISILIEERASEASKLFKAGVAEEGIIEAFKVDEDEFQKMMDQAVASMQIGGY